MKEASWTRSFQQQPVVLVALIMVAAAAARFYHLGVQPLWLDEALTWLYAGAQYQETAGSDVHPPLYFSLVRVWMHGVPGLEIPALAVQDNEFFLRLPSAVLGVLTVPLVFAVGRVIGGIRLGLVAALLFAVAPFQVRYGQEARMYALLTFLAVLVMWGVAWLLTLSRVDASGANGSEADSRALLGQGRALPAWLAIVAGRVGALYTHNTAVVLLISWNLVVLMCLLAGGLRQPRFVWHWSAAIATILVCWTPWLPRMLGSSPCPTMRLREKHEFEPFPLTNASGWWPLTVPWKNSTRSWRWL